MEKMFNENIPLVYKVFNDRIKHNLNYQEYMKEDLIQIGMLTLWKCCQRYDPERNAAFSTYAYSAIYKNMMCSMKRESKKTQNLVSLNKPIMYREDDEITLEDVIATPCDEEKLAELKDLAERTMCDMKCLPKKIVRMFLKGHSRADISRALGLSRSYVYLVIKKFRNAAKEYNEVGEDENGK